MAQLDIGPLGQEDIPDIVSLWRAAGLTRAWNDPVDDARLALAGPSSAILGGRIEGALAATAMVGWDGHRGSVYYLAVASAFRGLGYGRQLMSAAENWLSRFNAPKVNLMVRNDNASVMSFYDGLGYATDDVRVRSRRLRE